MQTQLKRLERFPNSTRCYNCNEDHYDCVNCCDHCAGRNGQKGARKTICHGRCVLTDTAYLAKLCSPNADQQQEFKVGIGKKSNHKKTELLQKLAEAFKNEIKLDHEKYYNSFGCDYGNNNSIVMSSEVDPYLPKCPVRSGNVVLDRVYVQGYKNGNKCEFKHNVLPPHENVCYLPLLIHYRDSVRGEVCFAQPFDKDTRLFLQIFIQKTDADKQTQVINSVGTDNRQQKVVNFMSSAQYFQKLYEKATGNCLSENTIIDTINDLFTIMVKHEGVFKCDLGDDQDVAPKRKVYGYFLKVKFEPVEDKFKYANAHAMMMTPMLNQMFVGRVF